MKKHEIIFSVVKLPIDFLIVIGSFFLAKHIRSITDLIPGIQLPSQTIDSYNLIWFALFGAFLYVGLFISHGLYSSKISHSKIKEFGDIIRYGIYWFGFFALFIFLGKGYAYDGVDLPRLIIAFSFVLSVMGSIISRMILNQLQYALMSAGIISKRNLVLINNKKKSQIQDILSDIKKANIYNVVGYINKQDLNIKKLDYLGKQKEFLKLCQNRKVDEILSIESDFSKKELYKIWDISRIFGVRYRYLTNSFDITKTNTRLSLIHNIPTMEIQTTPLGMWGRVLKRFSDIVLSLGFIILLSPLLLLCWCIIKIGDIKAPAIYKNIRIGQNGSKFTLYKFRYMKWKYCIKQGYGVEEKSDIALKKEQQLIKTRSSRQGPLYKINNDPRKTKFGKFIEKYSIDELPQLVNVLLGNMSLVGPRPHQPREVEKYSLYQKRLLTIKPGMTGMAQVNGREKNTFDDEAKLDIFYIENWSVLLDLKILLKTLPIIFNRK